MPDTPAILEAIERLQKTLWSGLLRPDTDPALAATSGIPAIDALLDYVNPAAIDALRPDVKIPREIIRGRLQFLWQLREAMDEPETDSGGRGRKDKAKRATKHLRDAAADLQALGSDGLGEALMQLAALIEARAHVSVIEVVQLSSSEIVPGTRLLATHSDSRLSAYHVSNRGASAHRPELIRYVCSCLQEATPAALVATLFRDVLGIECTAKDARQALGRQGKPAQGPSDADAAMRAWR